jgi:hypothetical protein
MRAGWTAGRSRLLDGAAARTLYWRALSRLIGRGGRNSRGHYRLHERTGDLRGTGHGRGGSSAGHRDRLGEDHRPAANPCVSLLVNVACDAWRRR